jgi:hypothetical protein
MDLREIGWDGMDSIDLAQGSCEHGHDEPLRPIAANLWQFRTLVCHSGLRRGCPCRIGLVGVGCRI